MTTSTATRVRPRRALPLLAALAATLGVARAGAAQQCVLDYQRANTMWANAGDPVGDLGVETLVLPADGQQSFTTDWAFERLRGTEAARYGSHLRIATNRGDQPVSIGLVGPLEYLAGMLFGGAQPVLNYVSTLSNLPLPVRAMASLAAQRSANWIILAPGERAATLRADLGWVACGEKHQLVSAIRTVINLNSGSTPSTGTAPRRKTGTYEP